MLAIKLAIVKQVVTDHSNDFYTQCLVSYPTLLPGTDFNNATVTFTIPSGAQEFDIQMRDIIFNDTVNEAEEILILVLELTDTGGMDINFDEELGILIFNILDDNRRKIVIC